MLKKELAQRELLPILKMKDGQECTPALWPQRRQELIDILSENIYGYTPPAPEKVAGTVVATDDVAYAGKVLQEKIKISFTTPQGEFSFPLHLFTPHAVEKPPVFLHIAFRPDLPDRYSPIEEICDNGFALALFCYHDVTPDSLFADYTAGLAAHYIKDNKRSSATEWGKIGMWAFGASRALDYLKTRDDLDHDKVAVIGHSRLGKTALWCAAQDERFYMAVSNNSGFGGAAIAKHGAGERVADFLRVGSYDWYCEKFQTFLGQEDQLPYDQHFLLAAIAPRLISVGSAELDRGADPRSELLSCLSASQAYELLGEKGLVTPDEFPKPGTHLAEGRIGYHYRSGTHFFSRYDWNRYMEFFRSKLT